jgi:hypothetical protein
MMSPPDVAMYLLLHRTHLGSIGAPEAPIVPCGTRRGVAECPALASFRH